MRKIIMEDTPSKFAIHRAYTIGIKDGTEAILSALEDFVKSARAPLDTKKEHKSLNDKENGNE